jgi:halocyanin-like protein
MSEHDLTLSRRTVLRGAAGAAAAGTGLAGAGGVAAQEDQPEGGPEPDYGGWLSNTGNYDGTVDKRGQDSVTVTVGAEGNNGAFAFAPAAVRVDPGTEVVWEWSGKGGQHNVVAEGGAFESALVEEGGHTFAHTFTSPGIAKYACTPHEPMGMKGAVAVGSPESRSAAGFRNAVTLAGGTGLLGAILGLFAYGTAESGRGP